MRNRACLPRRDASPVVAVTSNHGFHRPGNAVCLCLRSIKQIETLTREDETAGEPGEEAGVGPEALIPHSVQRVQRRRVVSDHCPGQSKVPAVGVAVARQLPQRLKAFDRSREVVLQQEGAGQALPPRQRIALRICSGHGPERLLRRLDVLGGRSFLTVHCAHHTCHPLQ